MKVKIVHPWKVDTATARQIQDQLRNKIILKPPSNFKPGFIAGADAAYSPDDKAVVAAAVVMKYAELKVVEETLGRDQVQFPYIPGLLTFREGPALLKALAKVKSRVDLLLFDGQGIAHPRGLGLAAHMGVILDISTIGCAKTRLVGSFVPPADVRGATSPLLYEGNVVGYLLKTRAQVKPIFVSPGHRMDLKNSLSLVMACSPKYRIPEPLRQAHALVKAALRQQG